MTISTVTVQTTPESQPSTPNWMGEVAAFAQIFTQTGMLTAITEQVRFARARMGTYELIDFVVVLIGYALSGEPTLQAFYEHLLPFADGFMALFDRKQLPSRSALSRFLAALDQASVESLRTLFQQDLLARTPFADPGGITDRCKQGWLIADVDGTRKVARQRALPQTESLPAPHRRFAQVCAKGHQGRQRGEVVRTRTVVLQAHTHQFLGTFGGAGNGDYRGELLRVLGVLTQYAKQMAIPLERILVRLDGLYGNAAPLFDVLAAHLGMIARHKDYLWRAVDQNGNVLDILVQSRRNKKAAKRFFRKLLKGVNIPSLLLFCDLFPSYNSAIIHIPMAKFTIPGGHTFILTRETG